MSLFVASIGFGLVTASVLAIASVGFTLQFAVTDVLNLAYGAVMIFGAFVAYAVNQAGLSVWIGLLAAIAAGSLLSVLLNIVVYTPFQRRGAVPDHHGDRVARDDADPRVRPQAVAGGDQRLLPMSQRPDAHAGGLNLTVVQFAIIALSRAGDGWACTS